MAVPLLKMSDSVGCGHSQCGAVMALKAGGGDRRALPQVSRRLDLAAPVRRVIARDYADLPGDAERLRVADEENTRFSRANLPTSPGVLDRLADGSRRVAGGFFNIATAEPLAYDPASKRIEPLAQAAQAGA